MKVRKRVVEWQGGRCKMIRKLSRYFFQGLVFLAPIGITGYILYQLFTALDSWFGLTIPGAGLLITISAVTLLGFLTSNFLTRRIFVFLEQIINRLPFVKLLHSSLKDVLTAFVGDKKKFDRPVLVNVLPDGSIKALGFMTQDSLEQFHLTDHVAIYFPQSYNFAGNLLLYPRDQIVPLSVDNSRLMAFIVSGGITR